MARLELLGPPRWIDDRGERPLQPTIAACLVIRLASAGGWTSRDALLPLLWPDADESNARTSLRQLLRSLPADVAEAVERDGNALRYTGPCDLTDAALLEIGAAWSSALALHRGPFLADFAPRRAPAFETWADEERTRWNRAYQTVARRAFEHAVAAGAVEGAVDAGRRWTGRDPLDAEVVAAVTVGLRRLGANAEATEIVNEHARAVAELGLPLDDALVVVGSPDARLVRAAANRPWGMAAGRGAIPPGRASDVAALADWWAGPGRWLTVVAPGGMGKTTLVQAWVASLDASCVDHDHVDLNGVSDADEATRRAVASLGRGSRTSRTGLEAFHQLVGERPHLLVLDAAEDLVDAAETLAAWSSAAPGLRLVVTSRRTLGGRGEQVQKLAALPVARPADGGASVAAEVAWTRARSAAGADSAGIPPPPVVQHAVERIGGWPLGLVLLAGWAAWLGLDGWLAALERDDPDLGSDDATRTIAASWRHLDDAHRDAIGQLSGVPRPWALDDARAVGVAPARVADLAATGWVTASEGDFTIHPLLVDHARSARPRHHDDARAAHARHVLADFVAAYERTGRPPAGAWGRLHHLRAAWGWSCDAIDLETLARAFPVVERTLFDAGRTGDVAWGVARAQESLANAGPEQRARPLASQLARDLTAAAMGVAFASDRTRCLALAERLESEADVVHGATILATVAMYRALIVYFDEADWPATERLARDGLALLQGRTDRGTLYVAARLANLIGLVATQQQRPDDARAWLVQAERDASAAGGPSEAARWGYNVVHLDLQYGNYRQALARNSGDLHAVLRDGAPLHLTFGWSQRTALALALGDASGARAGAEQVLAASAGMHPDVRDAWRNSAWRSLAEAALLDGDPDEAGRWLARCRHGLEVERVRAEHALAIGDALGAVDHARAALGAAASHVDGNRDPESIPQVRALEATGLVLAGIDDCGAAVAVAIDVALALPYPPLHARAARPALAWALAADDGPMAAELATLLERATFCDGATRRAARILIADHPRFVGDPGRSVLPASAAHADLIRLLATCADQARSSAIAGRRTRTQPARVTTTN